MNQPAPDASTAPPKPSRAARVALALSILALLTSVVGIGGLLGIAALVLGIQALNQLDDPRNAHTGRPAAQWAILLGGASIAAAMVVAFTCALVIPATSRHRGGHRQMQTNTQLRGIHQGMVTYAQNNRTYFPGLDSQGNPLPVGSGDAAWQLTPGDSVERRYAILLDGNYFTGEYAISPVETRTAWTSSATPVSSSHYSFAMLDISETGGRRDEWRETFNTEAVILSDRNTGTASQVQSIYTTTPGNWRGSVAWNDNHTGFENSHLMAQTQYGAGQVTQQDSLFQSPATDDALMIYLGN